VVALGLAVLLFELFSGVAVSQADRANDNANITMSFLVIVFLHSLLRRLGNQFAGEAFLSGVNGGKW
jgi:hypothetical protein